MVSKKRNEGYREEMRRRNYISKETEEAFQIFQEKMEKIKRLKIFEVKLIIKDFKSRDLILDTRLKVEAFEQEIKGIDKDLFLNSKQKEIFELIEGAVRCYLCCD